MFRRILALLLGTLAFAVAQYLWLRSALVPVPPEPGPLLQAEWAWLVAFLSAPLRSLTVYAFLLVANAAYLYNLCFHFGRKPRWQVAVYIVWYVLLFLFFVAVATGPMAQRWHFGGMHRLLLYGLFLLMTTACFHVPVMFGFLLAVLVSYFVLPFYAEATLALLSVLYLVALALLSHARRTRSYVVLTCFLVGFVLLLVVFFPLVNLAMQRSPQDLDRLLRGTDASAVATRDAIVVSLKTATVSTLIVLVLGVPLAYVLVRGRFPGRGVLDAMVDLPIVLPPPAAGIALAMLVGPDPGFAGWLEQHLGLRLVGDWKGVCLAQIFVSSPFLIRSAMAAIRSVDPRLEHVSRTLGARPAWTVALVTLPLAARGIFMGCILAWGRAIGEFGSVVILAPHPETMPVRIYNLFVGSGDKGPSMTVAILMVVMCTAVFAGLHLLASRTLWRNVHTVWSRFGDPDRAAD